MPAHARAELHREQSDCLSVDCYERGYVVQRGLHAGEVSPGHVCARGYGSQWAGWRGLRCLLAIFSRGARSDGRKGWPVHPGCDGGLEASCWDLSRLGFLVCGCGRKGREGRCFCACAAGRVPVVCLVACLLACVPSLSSSFWLAERARA